MTFANYSVGDRLSGVTRLSADNYYKIIIPSENISGVLLSTFIVYMINITIDFILIYFSDPSLLTLNDLNCFANMKG